MKTLKKFRINTPPPKKYTLREFFELALNRQWNGGEVINVGYVPYLVTIIDKTTHLYQFKSLEAYYGYDGFSSSIPPEYDDQNNNHLWGSRVCAILGYDCFYRCLGALISMNSLKISDLYGHYLVNNSLIDDEDVNEYIAQGVNANSQTFVDFAKSNGGLSINLEVNNFNDYFQEINTNSVSSLTGIAVRSTNSPNSGHAEILKGKIVNGLWQFNVHDLQKSTVNPITEEELKKNYSIYYIK